MCVYVQYLLNEVRVTVTSRENYKRNSNSTVLAASFPPYEMTYKETKTTLHQHPDRLYQHKKSAICILAKGIPDSLFKHNCTSV